MFNPENLTNTVLEKFLRKFSQEEFLFMQGDLGNTMFIILEGTIVLWNKTGNTDRLVGTLSSGEVLGEKAILTTAGYRRSFSAQAKAETTLLEIDSQNLKVIQSKIPDFTIKILKIISERLDKANQLTTILQISHSAERFVQYLLYFCRHHFKKVPEGVELELTAEEIHETANVELSLCEEYLKQLVSNRVLVKKKQGYVVADENALLQYLPTLKDQMAA